MTASPTGSDGAPRLRRRPTQAAATLCESLGHRVEVGALDVDGDAFIAHFVNVWAAGNAWAVGDWEAPARAHRPPRRTSSR